ncbi:hypothetical protein, partial [Pseudomonas defluvii]|uniref:hypothetical protein n=1 Tax=Pseudomonas defluvii TaxID=1876757 RepID=UPI001C400DD1
CESLDSTGGWLSASRFKRCAYSMNSGPITFQTPDWQPCLYEKFQIFLLQNASRMQFCRGETFSCFFQLQLAQRPELRGFAGRDARDFR